MQTDLERNSCMLCGEIWNGTNLIKIEFKGHQLRMCPECASDFDSYVKDKIIAELEKITNEILNLEDEETDLDDDYEFGMYQGYKCCELLIGKHIAELKGE